MNVSWSKLDFCFNRAPVGGAFSGRSLLRSFIHTRPTPFRFVSHSGHTIHTLFTLGSLFTLYSHFFPHPGHTPLWDRLPETRIRFLVKLVATPLLLYRSPLSCKGSPPPLSHLTLRQLLFFACNPRRRRPHHHDACA